MMTRNLPYNPGYKHKIWHSERRQRVALTDVGGCKRQPEHRNQGRARRTEEEEGEGCNTSLHKPTQNQKKETPSASAVDGHNTTQHNTQKEKGHSS